MRKACSRARQPTSMTLFGACCVSLQPDPIGYAGGLNLYDYANGDPVNFSDPLGLDPGRDVVQPSTGLLGGFSSFLDGQSAGFAGLPLGGSGPGGSLSYAEWTALLTWNIYWANLRAPAPAPVAQHAPPPANPAPEPPAWTRQLVSVLDTIFGQGLRNIANDPLTYGLAFVGGAAAQVVGRTLTLSMAARSATGAVGVTAARSVVSLPNAGSATLQAAATGQRAAQAAIQSGNIALTGLARGNYFAKTFGGSAADWFKLVAPKYRITGTIYSQSVHGFINVKTGQTVYAKTIFEVARQFRR